VKRQIIPNYVLVVATGLLMALTTGASPAAITFHTDFEGGNLGKVERVGQAHFRCTIDGECDQDGRNRQTSWFYFRVDDAAGQELTLDFGTLPGEYNYQPNRGGFDDAVPPVISYDRKTWTHLSKAEYDENTNLLTVRFQVKHSPVWIARIAPYTNRDLARLMEEITRSPFLKRTVIGRSVESRPIWFLTITDPAVPDKDKKVLWLMARQHSWESGTSWVNEGALRFLISSDPNAQWLRKHCVFNDFPLCDPDGVARGGVRFNRYGYDLNRNWDTADPKNMPEIAALRKTVLDWVDSGKPVDLFLAMHNDERGEVIMAPPTGPGPDYTKLGDRFLQILKAKTSFHATGPVVHTKFPSRRGRMSVYQGLYHDREIPSFLSEQMISSNETLGGYPTVQDRLKFGGELVQAMAEAVFPPSVVWK